MTMGEEKISEKLDPRKDGQWWRRNIHVPGGNRDALSLPSLPAEENSDNLQP